MAAQVWALSDFHLPGALHNTMDTYGEVWANHPEKIFASVSSLCSPDDLILVAGDISWASRLPEAGPDFEWLSTLPCTVVLSEGNHDHWAKKPRAVSEALPKNATWVGRGCYRRGNVAIVAARLWDFDGIFPWPGHAAVCCQNPKKIQNREQTRLQSALKLLPQGDGIIRILMVHFPPLAHDASPGPITELINKYRVHFCVYGHVHGQQEPLPAMDAVVGGTRFLLTSCDWLNMTPIRVCEYRPLAAESES
jgi:predicted phosphohydrolase